jgi:hypothetical protein
LIPRIFLAFTALTSVNERSVYLMLSIGLLAGSVAIAFINKLPSKT